MKTSRIVTIVLALACIAGGLFAAPIPGPKGGRILTTAAPYAEFFVEKDHSATVTFYDANLKPLAPGEQVVSVVAEAKSGKAKLNFNKTAGGFASDGKLPKGDDYNIVIQIKDTPAATPKNYRVYFEDEACEKCHRAQYACICGEKK